MTTSSTYEGILRRTHGIFFASFKVGMTTLTEALVASTAGIVNVIGSWMEMDKYLTAS
jgi:hypothetical protein